MGIPIVIDSLSLTLGRFRRKQAPGRNIHEGRMKNRAHKPEPSVTELITLSSGQMLLPEIGAPYQFLK